MSLVYSQHSWACNEDRCVIDPRLSAIADRFLPDVVEDGLPEEVVSIDLNRSASQHRAFTEFLYGYNHPDTEEDGL